MNRTAPPADLGRSSRVSSRGAGASDQKVNVNLMTDDRRTSHAAPNASLFMTRALTRCHRLRRSLRHVYEAISRSRCSSGPDPTRRSRETALPRALSTIPDGLSEKIPCRAAKPGLRVSSRAQRCGFWHKGSGVLGRGSGPVRGRGPGDRNLCLLANEGSEMRRSPFDGVHL